MNVMQLLAKKETFWMDLEGQQGRKFYYLHRALKMTRSFGPHMQISLVWGGRRISAESQRACIKNSIPPISLWNFENTLFFLSIKGGDTPKSYLRIT